MPAPYERAAHTNRNTIHMTHPMHQMQYLLPEGYPSAKGQYDQSIVDLTASLKNVDTKGAAVPNSALWLKLNVFLDGSSLEIKKRKVLTYINIFNIDGSKSSKIFGTVQGLYEVHHLGTPKEPKVENWIHSIPIPPAYTLLRENEVILCEQLTIAFFWAVYAQWFKKHNPLN